MKLMEQLCKVLKLTNRYNTTAVLAEIFEEITSLKDYKKMHEGAVGRVSIENSRLWYMVRIAMKDPLLDNEAARKADLDNQDVYNRMNQSIQAPF